MNQIEEILKKHYPITPKYNRFYFAHNPGAEQIDLNEEARNKARKCMEELAEKIKGLQRYKRHWIYAGDDSIDENGDCLLVSDIENLLK